MATNKAHDLHGSAPDTSPVALLLIDVVNDLEFPEGDRLLRRALPMTTRLARLIGRARRAKVPIVWVNDNFGRWRSDFRSLLRYCTQPDVRGRPIVERLAPPAEQDYFVVKPKHSGFFITSLELLLEHLGTKTVVLTGMATEVCVLFTANDAYMRDFEIVVASDCVASSNAAGHAQALALMRSALKAKVVRSTGVDFARLGRAGAKRSSARARRPSTRVRRSTTRAAR
jgi:nicotinamidase-related amidase